MAHTFKPHPTGHTCTTCGRVAGNRQDATHIWTEATPDTTHANTRTPSDTAHTTPIHNNALGELRQHLTQLEPNSDTGTHDLRDLLDPTRRIATNA